MPRALDQMGSGCAVAGGCLGGFGLLRNLVCGLQTVLGEWGWAPARKGGPKRCAFEGLWSGILLCKSVGLADIHTRGIEIFYPLPILRLLLAVVVGS